MESSPQQNVNQYFHHQPYSAYSPTMMNFPMNNQQLHSGQMYIQNIGVPNFFFGCPAAFSQQMMYPNQFNPSQSVQPNYQNANLSSEDTTIANIEKLLLDTIPDLDGTQNNFEIKKFFKKFDSSLYDWPEKKKIFTLKSKLFGKAKSYFILAIKSKIYNYKSIKNFILCKLLPSEYKVEEPTNLIKKKTNSKFENLKKNCEKNEKLLPQPNNQNVRPKVLNRISIPFEDVSYPPEVLEFFESPEETKSSKVEKKFKLVKEMKISSPTNLNFKKTIKPEIKKKSLLLDRERENDFEFPMNLFEVDELKNLVPTNLPKKTIKKESREKNSVLVFEKENDFDLPMNFFEAKEEDEVEHECLVSEKNLAKDFEEADFELPMNWFEEEEEVKFKEFEKDQVETEIIEDIGFENMVQVSEKVEPVEKNFEELRKEKANELGRMKIDRYPYNQENSEVDWKNFENSDNDLDPIIEENFKEPRKEKANELSRMKADYEFIDQNVLEIRSENFMNSEKESVILKEFIGKENESEELIASFDFEFMKVLKLSKRLKRKLPLVKEKNKKKSFKKNGNFKGNFKSNVRNQFEEYSFSEKYSVLKKINSKIKLLKISVLKKIKAKMKNVMKQGKFGWRKRKIKGRFLLGVRRRLDLKKLITLIRASNQFPNFPREKRRLLKNLKPKKDLHSVSVTKQVIQTSQMAMISLEKTRVPNKKKV